MTPRATTSVWYHHVRDSRESIANQALIRAEKNSCTFRRKRRLSGRFPQLFPVFPGAMVAGGLKRGSPPRINGRITRVDHRMARGMELTPIPHERRDPGTLTKLNDLRDLGE